MILGIQPTFGSANSSTSRSVQETFEATQGQTVFVTSAIADTVDVSINNAVLVLNIDYTHIAATNVVTLINSANANDIITIRSHT